jgi:hypothetical protein
MGPNGELHVRMRSTANNTAGSKVVRMLLGGSGGTVVSPAFQLANNVSGSQIFAVTNRGVANRQIGDISLTTYGGTGLSTSAYTTASIDTASATTLVVGIIKAVATDNAILESYSIDSLYRP